MASSRLIPSTQATSFSPMGSERKALSLGDICSIFCNGGGRTGLGGGWLLTVRGDTGGLLCRGMRATDGRLPSTTQYLLGTLRCQGQCPALKTSTHPFPPGWTEKCMIAFDEPNKFHQRGAFNAKNCDGFLSATLPTRSA